MKIFLIGFMGSGKSFTGQKLAKLLNFRFFDLDTFIENNEKKSISQIFAESGEQRFRDIERKYLLHTIDLHRTIIATGGGTPCFFDSIDWMNTTGITIYLKSTPEILAKRLLKGKNHRPLITGKTKDELKEYIKSTLNEREPFYERAHLIFSQNEENIDVAKEISWYVNKI